MIASGQGSNGAGLPVVAQNGRHALEANAGLRHFNLRNVQRVQPTPINDRERMKGAMMSTRLDCAGEIKHPGSARGSTIRPVASHQPLLRERID